MQPVLQGCNNVHKTNVGCLHSSALLFQLSSIKYVTKALSTFHQINAYEEDGFLIIDMCASDDGQAINNYNVQNLRKSGDALDEVSKLNVRTTFPDAVDDFSLVQTFVGFGLKSQMFPHQVYNTLCRVFPRRFVLPLNVDNDTPFNQNLNGTKSTATAMRISKNKVSS